ncbi:MAG: putative DNA binding domain-containing protein [Bacteroidetes bacterium]|nr:putative DNA binding domain-containing protein [Bacteroidota bacterium]
MTRTELLEIIAARENSRVEFKRDDVAPEKVAKECVALLNLKGGYVLLGVEDNGDISGITRNSDECQIWVMDTVFGRFVHPLVIPTYEEVVTDNGRVAVISLDQGISKPYSLKINDRFDTYVRIGNISRLATHEQKLRLMQEGGLLHIETLPVNGTSLNELDQEKFTWYYQKFYNENVPDQELGELLTRLDFAVKKDDRIVLTIAGLILFGNSPAIKLRQSGFRLIAYPGSEPDINSTFDEGIDGSIVSVRRNGTIVKSGLIETTLDRLQILISEEKLNENGINRERVWIYPKEVLREIIVNAVAHRDWTKFTQNKIEIFDNRIEITSAGSIPNNQTLEKILAGVQYSRNQILSRVLRDIGEMEERGMGLRRKVVPILKKEGYPDPQWEPTEDYFKIILYRK